MQNSNFSTKVEKADEGGAGILASLLEKVMGGKKDDSKIEKQDLGKETKEVIKRSKKERVGVSLNLFDEKVDKISASKESKGKRKVDKVSAETRELVGKLGILQKGVLLLRGKEFREKAEGMDQLSRAKLIFSEIHSLEKQRFSEVWGESEGFFSKMKNTVLWAGIKIFKQTDAGKEVFGTVDKYDGLAMNVKEKVGSTVSKGKETIETAEEIKHDNAAASAMAKKAPGKIKNFLKTPNKSKEIIEFLKKSTKNPAFRKMVADGKVRGLSLSKKVGAGGIIILAAGKIKELITTGEISMGDEKKSFFENWIFDYDALVEKTVSLKNSVVENGVMNSKLAALECSFEVADVILTGATIFALGTILITSAPLTMGVTFLSALWLFLRKGSLSALRKIIPKIGLFFTEKFGKKGAKKMLGKAVKSKGVKKVGKSVAIQTGFQMAMDKGIDFVNNHLLSSAKKVGKKMVSSQLSTNQKFILRKAAGVEL